MYALRRNIVAFALGALILGAVPVTIAAPPVPTLAQVLASGNTVPGGATIEGPNGTKVTFAASGTMAMESAGGTVNIASNGLVEMASSGGGSVLLYPDGTIQLTALHGTHMQSLYFGDDVELYLGLGGLWLGSLPTTDPLRLGFLWSDGGTVKVSAG